MLFTGITLSLGVWFRGLWNYYWQYTRTRTGTHAATTAALTGFRLLAYFHRAFVVVAILSYIIPPAYLYMTEDEGERNRFATGDYDTGSNEPKIDSDIKTDEPNADSDSDSDSDDADTDTDSDGDDADADADGADADADGYT